MTNRHFDEIRQLNTELLKMADFAQEFWNGGARFWLEHRAPAVARAITSTPGLKLWLGAVPNADCSYQAKACALLADHVVIGHHGPLPRQHLALAFPWREDYSNEIPDLAGINEPTFFRLRMDAVRRPLPPVAKQVLFGSMRAALAEGVVSYLPVSVLYSPLGDGPWPDPREVVIRDGSLPIENRYVLKNEVDGTVSELVTSANNPSGTLKPMPNVEFPSSPASGPSLVPNAERGFFVSDDPRVYSEVWEPSEDAMTFEAMFAGVVTRGNLTGATQEAIAPIAAPAALLEIRLPFVGSAPWDAILELRYREREALETLRFALIQACSSVSAARGTKAFQSEVAHIQKRLVDEGVREVERSFRSLRLRRVAQAVGFTVGAVSVQIACYLGLPPLASIPAAGLAVERGIKLAMDLRKEQGDWLKRTQKELPMYFVWKLNRFRASLSSGTNIPTQ